MDTRVAATCSAFPRTKALANAGSLPLGALVEIDAVARRPLWDVGLVYRHGTGHGIGMFLVYYGVLCYRSSD